MRERGIAWEVKKGERQKEIEESEEKYSRERGGRREEGGEEREVVRRVL